MKKQISVFIKNIMIVIGIMYISIFLKNILQISIGTLFNYDSEIKVYKPINLREESSIEDIILLSKLILIYDFILFVFIFYFWTYFLLYLIITQLGNKLWFQIGYTTLFYLISVICFDYFHPSILFILITIILGIVNWWMFKIWIK
ncbi:hypothetical protein D1631_12235 [Chryseobacterium nematophagum]|uniref:Uncharacterized protein n=1 Tax=Chryseobacterium nematophagum TaxID=2305228 RepID=A0A3M7TJ11_9FLAO|nr:hypothetical protein D1631_12235 [Chryseobacterium nematophagum]